METRMEVHFLLCAVLMEDLHSWPGFSHNPLVRMNDCWQCNFLQTTDSNFTFLYEINAMLVVRLGSGTKTPGQDQEKMVFQPQTQQEKCPDGASKIPCLSTVNVPNVFFVFSCKWSQSFVRNTRFKAANIPNIFSKNICFSATGGPDISSKRPLSSSANGPDISNNNPPFFWQQMAQMSYQEIPDLKLHMVLISCPEKHSLKLPTSRQTTWSVAANRLENVPTSH